MTGDDASGMPPWHCRLEAVIWWHRAAPCAATAVPAGVRPARRLPVTLAALVRYAETPVGPYGEIAGSPVLFLDGLRPAGHVPFIAVDSEASAAAGRELWALPKLLAELAWPSGPLAAGTARATARAAAGDWSLAVHLRPRRARVPFAVAGRCVQRAPDGARVGFPVAAAGLATPARVRLQIAGSAAPAWLLGGAHPALVLSRTRLRIGHPG